MSEKRGAELGSLKYSMSDGEKNGDAIAKAKAQIAAEVDPIAKTTATPLPPPPSPKSEPEPVQTETGSFEVSVEDDSAKTDDAVKAARQTFETLEAPAVNPASAQKPSHDFNTGERGWFASEPKDDNAPASESPPPFTSERLTDSGPVPVSPAPTATPAATAAAGSAVPRPNHHRVAMLPATPARLFWVNYRARIVSFLVGLVLASGTVGYHLAPRDAPAVSGSTTSDASETDVSESDPFVAPVEETRPTLPVMPPERPTEPRSEPGLTGVSGTVVRLPARDAYPTSCRTAGTRRIPGVTFLCGRGQLRGTDACNCIAAGRVP
ncbi:MAG: hypothetical protein NUW08_03630 [Candidatus Uhrbacteria bacterium]|nr:hypothetical protein [Candidatus Uhrbacteria bacterium]